MVGKTSWKKCNVNVNSVKQRENIKKIDNILGDETDFAHLIAEADKNGIKIILDGVFNHCGSFNKWLDRECIYENAPGYEDGAFVSEKSKYHTFFKFKEDKKWPYNKSYEGWWGHDTLPKLNYEESKELEEYILS